MSIALAVMTIICVVIGAGVLYGITMIIVWTTIVRISSRRSPRRHGDTSGFDGRSLRRLSLLPKVSGEGDRRSSAGPPPGPSLPPVADRRARSWDDLPGWLSTDRPWAVAVVLLGTREIRDRTAMFVDFPARSIDWSGLLLEAQTWPAGERLLVQGAYDLAGRPAGRRRTPDMTLNDLAELLDADGITRRGAAAAAPLRETRAPFRRQ